MSVRRGEACGSRRAPALAALVLLLVAAAGVAGCGGSSPADPGPFLGLWQRVEAGTPNPDLTLTIAAQGDGASLAFSNRSNGMSETAAGTVEDGRLVVHLVLPGGMLEPIWTYRRVDEAIPANP